MEILIDPHDIAQMVVKSLGDIIGKEEDFSTSARKTMLGMVEKWVPKEMARKMELSIYEDEWWMLFKG